MTRDDSSQFNFKKIKLVIIIGFIFITLFLVGLIKWFLV